MIKKISPLYCNLQKQWIKYYYVIANAKFVNIYEAYGTFIIKHIFKENAKDEIDNILDLKLRKLNGLNSEESLREAGFFVDKMEWSENFFINNQGIGFFYNVYEIAPYASGTTELFIPFTEITEFLKPNHPFNWIKKHENSVKL